MATITKETVEIKAGELNLSVSYTTEGLRAVRAMVTFLEVELIGDKKKESSGGEEEKRVGNAQPNQKAPLSPSNRSPRRRILAKHWEAIAKGSAGIIYKEVLNAFLEEYKKEKKPSPETFYRIISEMYGEQLKKSSLSAYASMYKVYIRKNKLAKTSIDALNTSKEVPDTRAKKLPETHSGNGGYKEGVTVLRPIPIEKVVEIWNLLPGKFTNKEIKAHIPADIQQSGARIDATNYVIREFLKNTAFKCKETSPGTFLKNGGER